MNNLTSQQKNMVAIGAIVLLLLVGVVNIALVRGSIMFWVNCVLIFGAILFILNKMRRGYN